MNADELPDPYAAFFDWCKAHGFADVADCEPEDVDVKRMDEAIAEYGRWGRRGEP